MPKRDVSQEALRQVEQITVSKPMKGETQATVCIMLPKKDRID